MADKKSVNIHDVIMAFELNHPTTAKAIKKLGFKLKPLVSGKFRDVYKIKGYPLVVKLPRRYVYKSGDIREHVDPVIHSLKEITHIKEVKTFPSFGHLRRYIPKVYYANVATGVIIMKKYKNKHKKKFRLQESVIIRMFRDTFNLHTAEYGRRNMMRDKDDNPIVVDLGY